ncbi:MAG: hypothetical protein SFU85_10170 [Candidatus Methylacidiphilales bacterium]|nr:hypothetical protein [Candidatus Methylacidiphilales bacterium]
MHAHEVWQKSPPTLVHEILEASYLGQKKLYRELVADMAANLRKREQFLLKLPRSERHQLFHPLLGLPDFELLGQNLLIVWLGQTQDAMLSAFLDHMGIKHDGKGYAESFPESVEEARLKKAVTALYEAFPAEKVNIYLGVMERVSGVSWPALAPLVRWPADAPAV